MPVRVHLEFVRPAMRLARPVFDPDGKLVAGAGTQLVDRVVGVLRSIGARSVLVADSGDVRSWETIRPLADELRELDERLGPGLDNEPLRELHAALGRHLARRAERLAGDPGMAPGPQEKPDA
jgi:hypothetical protein